MAALITTAILVGGFPILMFASVKTVFYFGLLTTIAAVAALIADLFMLPLLLRVFSTKGQQKGADGVE
jgi:predicted RND superfamily exporter protein